MNNEQFFKAIDGIDDKLLKGIYEDSSEDLSEELPDAESQHGAVYRLEHKPLSWKTFAGAAAALAVAVGAGLAVKAGLDKLPVSPDPVYSDGAAEDSGTSEAEDPLSDNGPYWHVQSHGFDDLDHYSYRGDKDYTFIRVPDGMLEDYDFTKVGNGYSLLSILHGDVKWYTFPEDENFRVALIDGEYVPFIDSEVCEDYGVPFVEYPEVEDVMFRTQKECEYMGGISDALWAADTVEELEQALAECDPDHRIDRVVYYKNRDDYYNNIEMEDPSGVFTVGMCIQVYWDNYEMHYDRKVSNSDWRDFVYPKSEHHPVSLIVMGDDPGYFEYNGQTYYKVPEDWKAPGGVFGAYDFTKVGSNVGTMVFKDYRRSDAEVCVFPENEDILVAKMDGGYVPYVHFMAYFDNSDISGKHWGTVQLDHRVYVYIPESQRDIYDFSKVGELETVITVSGEKFLFTENDIYTSIPPAGSVLPVGTEIYSFPEDNDYVVAKLGGKYVPFALLHSEPAQRLENYNGNGLHATIDYHGFTFYNCPALTPDGYDYSKIGTRVAVVADSEYDLDGVHYTTASDLPIGTELYTFADTLNGIIIAKVGNEYIPYINIWEGFDSPCYPG